MRQAILFLLAFVGPGFAAPAFAYVSAPLATSVVSPEWVRKPSADDLARYYPEAAQRKGLGGHVRIECRLPPDGVLTDCKVLSETPPGLGFGEAALRASSQFRMRPGTRDGQPVEGSVVIPMTFARPASAPALTPATLWKAFIRNPVPLLLILFWLGRAVWAIVRRRAAARATLPPNTARPSSSVPLSPPPYADGVRPPMAVFTNDIISGGRTDPSGWRAYGFLIGVGLVLVAALFSLVLVFDRGSPLALWLKTHL